MAAQTMSSPPSAPLLRLQYTPSESKNSVTLVVDWCASEGWIRLEKEETADAQVNGVLVTPSGTVTGLVGISAGLADSVAPNVSEKIMGKNHEERAQIQEWLSWQSSSGQELGVLPRLSALNQFLGSKSVLGGKGIALSIADVATYGFVHDDLLALPEPDRGSLPHAFRWADYVQNKVPHIKATFQPIPVPKPTFNPPAPLPPPPPKAAAAPSGAPAPAPAAASGKPNKAEKAAAAAVSVQPAQPASSPQESGAAPAKGKGEKPAAPAPDAPALDLSILDIRVGEVTKAWKHPGADALYVEEIDLGEGEGKTRQVVSGLAKFMSLEEFQGRRVCVLSNVKPGKVRDVMSTGLVLCASNEDHSRCLPILPPPGAALGERVTAEGFSGAPEGVLNPKKKQFDKIQPALKTTGEGIAAFNGIPLATSAGPCTSEITNGSIK